MKKIILIFIMVMMIIKHESVLAQISGPSTVVVNSTHTYSYSNGFVFSPNWRLDQMRGTILSQTQSGTTYSATIRWNSVGSDAVAFFDGQAPLAGPLNVTITEPPPGQPTANTAPAATTTSTTFVASWNSVTAATSYQLDVSTVNNFASFVSGYSNRFVSTTSHTVTGLAPNLTYYYRVRAVNTGGPSPNSNVVAVLTAPGVPSSLNAINIESGSFTATWASSPGATGYQVEVATNNAFSPVLFTIPSSDNSASVVGLNGNTTYYYRVRSLNGSLMSGYSNFNTVTTLPPAPANHGASNIMASSFTANWGTVSGATNYRLLVSTDINFASLVLDITFGLSTSSNVTGLFSGTAYYFKVRASNSGWTTGYSTIATALTLPQAPIANNVTTISSTSFTATWDLSQGASSYRLDVSNSSSFSTYVGGYQNFVVSGSSALITGLSSNSTYFYRVRAINATGSSQNSNTITATTYTSPPVALTATNITTGGFTANWSAAAGASSYLLEVSLNSGFFPLLYAYNNITVTGTSKDILASPNTIYYYRIRAVNATGPSGSSNSISVLTFPSAPQAIPSTAVTSNSFIANWAAMPGITTYRLDVSTSSTFATFVTGYNNLSVTGTSRVVSGLTEQKTYYYRLRAVNGTGTSLHSNVIVGASFDKNYIKTTQINKSGIINQTQINALGMQDRIIAYDYFDGLGRSIQKVQMQGSPNGFDIVQPLAYDEYGREKFKYLPYATSDANGFHKPNPVGTTTYTGSPHQLYYANGTADKVADDAKPYSETVFIPSALNQILEQGSPGMTWQPDATHAYTSTDRTVKFAHEPNVVSEVLRWTYTYPTSAYPLGLVNTGTGSTPAFYSINQLFRNKTKDENYNETIEFKDKEGRLILKKVQAPAGQWAQTYYIYDVFGNLVCVLPPEAVARLATEYYQSGATDATKDAFLKRWAFRYTYDSRKRMTHKQVPGAEPVYMVYDKRDRLVLTQDGKQRSLATKYWTFTKYDELNRPILTGIKDTAAALTQAQMQNALNSFYTKGWTRLFETYVGNVAGNVHGYTNKSYPVVNVAATLNINQYLTVTYYDKYDFRSTWVGTFTYVNDALSQSVGGITYTQPAGENLRVAGQITGVKTKVLDGGIAGGYTWLRDIRYYDDKLRLIQVQIENYKGGKDRTSNLYDFTGKTLKVKNTHVEADVTWKDLVGSKQEGNKLFRTAAGAAWGTAGAASIQQLPVGQSGWIEFVTSEATTARMIGLSDVNTNANYNTIDYALYPTAAGAIYIYENGTSRGQFGTYAPGDVLKIDRAGSTIRYYKNNVLLYTSTVASSSALMADAAFFTSGATIANIRTSFSTNSRSIVRRFEYDHVGRPIRTWHQLDAQPEILLTCNIYNELGQVVDKKLHSTVAAGTDAKQSVDFRYNIRGWLSSINNAELAVNTTNDDTGDYFGMNLAYHDDLLTGNSTSLQYNGNISAIKWSVNQGYGTIKAMAYNYVYDAMNRLAAANHKQATTLGTWVTGQFDESGFTYDLNGNIKTLQRKGDGGVLIDNLLYNYGAAATASNRLLFIQDNATDAIGKWKGFYDGNGGAITDYSYDPNGNMITDLNKGISSAIAYNFLNLPEVVVKAGNTIRYVYNASGIKLSQVTTFGATAKQTDYAGEFIYENDALQFINHDEGRILMAAEQLVHTDPCDNTGNKTAFNASVAAVALNGEKYVRVTSNGTVARSGIFPIGGTFPVTPGDRYRIKARGYRTGTSPVHFLIKANTADLNWPAAALAASSTTESWMEQTVTVPAGATTLQAGVVWNTVTTGEIFYLNEFIIEKLSASIPEYQYHLKDHLGNVRVTFTTKDETLQYTATLEDNTQSTEQATFRNYARVTNDLFDHTDAGTAFNKVHLLNGGNNSQVGLTKSFAVMPGDVITAQVYAKHYGATGSTGNLAGFATALLSAFGLPAPLAGEIGTASAAIQSYGSFIAGGGNPGNTSWPKGFLNMLVFDKNYTLIDLAYQQLEAAYVQPVGSTTKTAHQLLSKSKVIKEPGYVYIYLSNEGSVQKDIYFDDLKIAQTKSKVIQANDYYPFGLTFNSFQRENSVPNKNQFNGKEKQDQLGFDWLDYGTRMYNPSIGRWNAIDPYASVYEHFSPYAYVANNPIISVDYEGKLIVYVNGFRVTAYATYTTLKALFRGIPIPAPHDHRENWFRNDPFDYWAKFDDSWSFPDENKFYVDGSNHPYSSADDRFTKGETEGKILADKIKSGEIELEDGETIKLIGHSHGAAHAMGLAKGLLDAGIDPELIQVLLFAAHQPNQIPTLPVNFLLQAYRDSDMVSGKGLIAYLTGSKNQRIGNNSDYTVMPDGNEDGLGNHGIHTYTAEEFRATHPKVYQYLLEKKIINEDGTINQE
jgi:RHS repeat-associated protein